MQAVRDPESGAVGFNVELGGYFSIKRNVMSIRWEQCAWGGSAHWVAVRIGCLPGVEA